MQLVQKIVSKYPKLLLIFDYVALSLTVASQDQFDSLSCELLKLTNNSSNDYSANSIKFDPWRLSTFAESFPDAKYWNTYCIALHSFNAF